MNIRILLDDACYVVIEPYKLIEQKLRNNQYDGVHDTNRIYTYYLLLKQNGMEDEVWDNPFINHELIQVKNLILHDSNHEMHLVMKISSPNKYEIDHVIDHLELLVEGPGHYQLIRSSKKYYAKTGTPLLDFISFFRWTEGQE